MPVRQIMVALPLTLAFPDVPAMAQTAAPRSAVPVLVPVPAKVQLLGLSADEAMSLVAILQDAQRQLRAGEFQHFALLSGAAASYDETRMPPRDAFLRLPFDRVWRIERLRHENRASQTHRLAYAPNGLGQLYWDIEVMSGLEGRLERVVMTYKAPAPF